MDEKNNSLKISIIIPVYNRDELLFLCLKSIKNNFRSNIEVIVVDDCSPQPFRRLVEDFGYIYIRHDKNKGAGASRNTGVRNASCDVLLFIDSDIELYPDTIDKIANVFDDDNSISAVTVPISIENKFNNFASKYKTAFFRWSAIGMKSDVAYICTSCAAIKKDVFLKIGGFSENYKGASWEDTEMGLSIIEKGWRIRFCKDIEVIHNKKLSLMELIKSDYGRTVDFVGLLIGKRKQINKFKKRGLKISNADKGVAVSLIIVNVMLLLLFIYFILSLIEKQFIKSSYFYRCIIYTLIMFD